jgi:PAS domain S-box-containing protein
MPTHFLRLLGSSLIIFGVITLVGWLGHIPILVQYKPTILPIMFNTALCFILVGVGILAYQARAEKTLKVMGYILCLFGCATLAQDVFGLQFYIDEVFAKSWIQSGIYHPGRATPSTAIGFILCGLLFIFIPSATRKVISLSVEVLIYLIFFLGIIGVSAYLFNLEFLYYWFIYTRMALPTAICFILIGLGMLYAWAKDPRSSIWYQGSEDKKIIFISSAIILIIAFFTGIFSFLETTNYQGKVITQLFQDVLKAEQDLLVSKFNHVLSEINSIRRDAAFQKEIQTRLQSTNSKLSLFLDLYLAEGFSGVSLYSADGKLILSRGRFIQNPTLQTPIHYSYLSQLLWEKEWFVQGTIPLSETEKIGFLHFEWPLQGISQLIGTVGFRKNVELLICTALNESEARCFPSRLSHNVHNIPLTQFNEPVPMKFALQGKSGVMTGYDYRQQRIVAAYAPFDAANLGMVLKMDLSELYAPIVSNLAIIIPIILGIIFLGITLLRFAIRPLVEKIVSAEKKLLQTNEGLQKKQEQYDLAVEGSQVGLWDWKVGGEEVYYSPSFLSMFGFKEQEWPSTLQSFKEHLHPEDQERVMEKVEEHLQKRVPYSIEYRLKTKSGEYRWVQAAGQAIWNEEGIPLRMSGSVRDITELKTAQQRQASLYVITQILSEAEQFHQAAPRLLRTICEGMGWDCALLWLADYDEQVLTAVSYWQKPACNLEDFLLASQKIKFAPNVGLPGKVWASAESMWIYEVQNDPALPRRELFKKYHLCTGFSFPILLGYKVLGVIEFFSRSRKEPNDTLIKMMETIGPQMGQFIQKKNFENALRRSETQKTIVLESSFDSIITVNDEGMIVSWNAPTETMFEYDKKELKGKNINSLLPAFLKIVSSAEGKAYIETLVQRKNTGVFPAEVGISEMLLENKHHYLVIIRDITERKKIQSLKDEFVSVVSHELRTPLTSIRGSLGLILGGAVGTFTDKAKKLLSIANSNCERLLLLINDILDVEKIEADKMVFNLQPFKVVDLIRKAIDFNAPFAEKYNVKLKVIQPIDPNLLIYVDPDRLMQVITNLISNAVKFSPEGSLVSLSVIVHNDMVRVNVIDQGIGISEEFKSRIFQKFTQADASNTRGKGGTGLGLSISKLMIEKMHGTLNFTSEANKGSNFYFDLPRFIENDAKVLQQPSSDMYKARLLVCEDDEAQAKYLGALLETSGYHVHYAYNVKQAKAFLEKHTYDALLLDLILPDQDGIAFIRELRKNKKTSTLPIIVMSIICETGKSLLQGEMLSVLDWLEKPLDYDKLKNAIKLIKAKSGHARPNILHVEDDYDIQKVVAEILDDYAEVVDVDTIQSATEKLQQINFDLVILDILLPDGNGVELLPLCAKNKIPVVVFSAVELDANYATSVRDVLVKSKTTHEDLLAIIQRNLKHE